MFAFDCTKSALNSLDEHCEHQIAGPLENCTKNKLLPSSRLKIDLDRDDDVLYMIGDGEWESSYSLIRFKA